MKEVIPFYEQLEDAAYEMNRRERRLQQRKILDRVHAMRGTGRLLDIGAGSGMLIQEALEMGYHAEGVEPSKWLCNVAGTLGLPVYWGSFPNSKLSPPYDIITLIDLIEHISNPMQLLAEVKKALADDGVGLVVTPDTGSVMARLFGFKWWHFRLSHIGYFNHSSLMTALDTAGFAPISIERPRWYFSADYIVERLNSYLPRYLRLPGLSFLRRVTIPLNLFDSLLVIFKKK